MQAAHKGAVVRMPTIIFKLLLHFRQDLEAQLHLFLVLSLVFESPCLQYNNLLQ